MYDLIEIKKVNKIKIAVLVLASIAFIILATLGGIKLAKYEKKREYYRALKRQEEIERLAEEEKKKEEEAKQQAIIQKSIEQTSRELTDEEKDRILHIYRSTGEKRVFLTFDDGPSESVTPLILDLLKKENVKATFFTLGGNVKAHPELVKREFDEGHYVANHGYSHKYSSVYESPEATLNEYNTTEQAIKDALGNQNYRSNLFRFPGGSNGGYYDEAKQNSKALLKENGVVHLDWNCLSQDAAGAHTKEALLQNVKDTMGEKDSLVILMHDSSDKILTYEMLSDLINLLRDKGYKFENIYDLLDWKNWWRKKVNSISWKFIVHSKKF